MGTEVLVGSVFNTGGPVIKVYVSAPEEVRVIVFGEPLKAWAQSEGLLSAIVSEGGGATRAFTTALLLHVRGLMTFTV